MKGRHRPKRNYQLRILFLSFVILLIANVIGYMIKPLTEAMARADLIAELASGAIMLACFGFIFLLVWAIMIQRKKLARSRNER